jgi:hypothetical protein
MTTTPLMIAFPLDVWSLRLEGLPGWAAAQEKQRTVKKKVSRRLVTLLEKKEGEPKTGSPSMVNLVN